MKGRTPTASEKEFMNDIANIGCIVCRNNGIENDSVSIHHMDGRVKTGCHYYVLPLCARHHQYADTKKPKRWYSLHGDGKAAFGQHHGTESELYMQCLEILSEEMLIDDAKKSELAL